MYRKVLCTKIFLAFFVLGLFSYANGQDYKVIRMAADTPRNQNNVATREAGFAPLQKIEMSGLEVEQSPFLGPREAKITIVEFANFECSHCLDSWANLRDFLNVHPTDIRYVFKHFPFQTSGKAFELAEMAAAAQLISNDAFWVVHDFLFSSDGQALATIGKGAVRQRIEQVLKEKGYDVQVFRSALEKGEGAKRVKEDMALGSKIPVTGTPTKVINGDLLVGSYPLNVFERYLKN